jgi:hypothetical protein
MKTTKIIANLFFLSILVFFIFGSCKKKDKCEGVKCINAYECVDGKCLCPEGKVKIGRSCLTPSKESYYCVSPCFCIDTFLLEIGKYTSKGDSTLRDIIISDKNGGGRSTDGWYYPSPDGDSLYTLFAITPVNDDPFVCKIQGHNLAPYFAGKVVNKTELKGKLYWWNPAANGVDLRDSCEVTMQKL